MPVGKSSNPPGKHRPGKGKAPAPKKPAPKTYPKPPLKPPSSSNYVRFEPVKDSGISPVEVLLGEGAVTVTSGYGGWTVQSRQRRVGLPVWQGRDPIRMKIPILFDAWSPRKIPNSRTDYGSISQEIAIARLSRMALPPEAYMEPPVIAIDGNAVPKPGPVNWVIESLEWGTDVIWDNAFNGVLGRVRQDCVVTVIQYIDEDRMAFKKLGTGIAANLPATIAPYGWQTPTRVKAGEKNLQQVARRVYKNAKNTDWKLIARANGINDPKAIKVGQPLKIPKRTKSG